MTQHLIPMSSPSFNRTCLNVEGHPKVLQVHHTDALSFAAEMDATLVPCTGHYHFRKRSNGKILIFSKQILRKGEIR